MNPAGPPGLLTATVMATSADDGCGGRIVRGVGLAEDAHEGVDALALEAESDVGVDASGDADVGVAEEFLDGDEVDALMVRSPAPWRSPSGGRPARRSWSEGVTGRP